MPTKKVKPKPKKNVSKKKMKEELPKPKKRGRKTKKILEESDNEEDAVVKKIKKEKVKKSKKSKEEMPAIVVQLQLDKKVNKKLKAKVESDSDSNSDEEVDDIFKNDIPAKSNACTKCVKHEKAIVTLKEKLDRYEQKENLEKSSKVYHNKVNIKFISKKKPLKGKFKCWWDTCPFENAPFHLPEMYYNDCYDVSGYFCSPNCALAYNRHRLKDSKTHLRTSLIYQMVRELRGLKADAVLEIKEAGPPEILDDHGGTMTIKMYRKYFSSMGIDLIVYVPPLKPLQMIVEEKNVEDSGINKKYAIQRKKPLKSKKKTILDSMGIDEEDNVD